MRIFILTKEPFPHGMAATNRITKYAQGLTINGVDCQVVITIKTESYNKIRNKKRFGITHDGVKFMYIPNSITRSNRFIKRRIDDLHDWFQVSSWIKRNTQSGDVVLFYNLQLLGMKQIVKTCHRNGVKIIRELCELPYGTSSDSIINKIKRGIYQKWIMPYFDGFIAISEALDNYAREHAAKAAIIRVPILIDVHQYDDVVPYVHANPYIFHAGTMYERKDAIVSTMKAFALASKEIGYSVDFILAGPESPHKKELEQIISDNNIADNVHFIGTLTHKEVLSYQKGAWLTILNKHDNLQNRNGFSTKLGDVLLAGTPVITTTVGEANNWLKDGESAFITEPHSIEAIAQQIIRAYQNPELLSHIAVGSQNVAKMNFDYKKQGARIASFCQKIIINDCYEI